MDKKCKKLGVGASKVELKEAHRIKMEIKEKMWEHNYGKQGSKEHVFANISKNHEFWGDTPTENEKRKHVL